MKWVALGLIIIAAWIIYSKRKGTVTLTKEQAELTLDLIRKERNEIEKKRQKIIDGGAAEGKTVPLESIFSHVNDESDELVKLEIEKQKKELLNKYGSNIPVDVVYRLIKQWDPDEESPWTDNPGCFERHLQRREGNILFAPERRTVSKKEIDDARSRDIIEQKRFTEKVSAIEVKVRSLDKKIAPDHANSILQEVQELLEEADSIGGNIGEYVQLLEVIEEGLIKSLSEIMDDGEKLLKQAQSLSILKRSPYIAQVSRQDSPILKEEELPTLLSEDLETIAFEGYKSKAFAPDYKPKENDIRDYLQKAVSDGFSKERADELIDAWIEGSNRYQG